MSDIEQTFLSVKQIGDRWGRSKTYVYDQVKAGRLGPPESGRWPLAEVKRYERESYKRCRRAMEKAA